jgi:hypothetical protein
MTRYLLLTKYQAPVRRLFGRPRSPKAEAGPLKGFQCGFESHRGHLDIVR